MTSDATADVVEPMPLECFACPNGECDAFNRFGAGNLSVCERMGKGKRIRRLYCGHCRRRFSERQGSLMRHAKLPVATVVRMVKCLTHGCSAEATADICEVDPRTVAKLLARAGPRADEFHRQALARLERPPAVVEMDELHARVARPPAPAGKKGAAEPASTPTPTPTPAMGVAGAVVAAVARWAATGSTRRWPWSRGS